MLCLAEGPQTGGSRSSSGAVESHGERRGPCFKEAMAPFMCRSKVGGAPSSPESREVTSWSLSKCRCMNKVPRPDPKAANTPERQALAPAWSYHPAQKQQLKTSNGLSWQAGPVKAQHALESHAGIRALLSAAPALLPSTFLGLSFPPGTARVTAHGLQGAASTRVLQSRLLRAGAPRG